MKDFSPAVYWILAAILIGLFGLLLSGCGASATTYDHGIPNLHQVAPGVWRSGQPTSTEQWRYLESLGIRWDIKLNDVREADDSAINPTSVTIIYRPLEPMGDVDIIDAITNTFVEPDDATIKSAVDWITQHKSEGVLIHCTHGQDRTGLAIGMWRVLDEGWATDVAYNEMLAMGFHPELHGLHEYWETFVAAHR